MAVAPLVQEKLTRLPDRPGVYLYRDEAGKILYVGKAVNLKNRVRSYFQGGGGHPVPGGQERRRPEAAPGADGRGRGGAELREGGPPQRPGAGGAERGGAAEDRLHGAVRAGR